MTYNTGVRKIIDDFLIEESKKKRDYGDYWSASSAGYCMRKVIFDRLGVPPVKDDPRKQRVFTSGHIFHDWIQSLTKKAGVSIAQEVELQDEDLMIRGHFDDLILVENTVATDLLPHPNGAQPILKNKKHLILYDYKTQNSRAFTWQEKNGRKMSYFHRLQLGTYIYEVRKLQQEKVKPSWLDNLPLLEEGRIAKVSKDDLRMAEEQLLWDAELQRDVLNYWQQLNTAWQTYQKTGTLPPCTCADHEGGFMSKELYNPYFYGNEPCSIDYFKRCVREGLLRGVEK